MLERVVARDTLVRVEGEELGEEVEREGVRLREELVEGDSGLVGEGTDVVLRLSWWRGRSRPMEKGKKGGSRSVSQRREERGREADDAPWDFPPSSE